MTRTIFLVAGWAFGESVWAPIAGELNRRGWRTAAFRSSDDSGLADALERTGGPAWLAGWSLGGQVAIRTALHSPGRVAAVLAVSSTPRFCAAPDFDAGVEPRRLRALSFALRARPADALGLFFRDAAAPVDLSESDIKERVTTALSLPPMDLAAGLKTLEATDLRARLSDLRVPLRCWHGDADRVIPCEASRRLAGLAPDAALRIEPGAGHDGFVRDPVRACDWIESCAREVVPR